MQPENFNQEQQQAEQSNSLHQVTSLSKYLAMTLFIILPFLGGWIWYTNAPEEETQNKTYYNDNYGFSFEYPGKYSAPTNVYRFPRNHPDYPRDLDDDRSRITFSSDDGLSFRLFGINHDLSKEGYGRPACTHSNSESLPECVKKFNKVGTEYFEREVKRNYGWEKGYEFKVNEDFSLIIVQQGGDNKEYEELDEYQYILIDTFKLVVE